MAHTDLRPGVCPSQKASASRGDTELIHTGPRPALTPHLSGPPQAHPPVCTHPVRQAALLPPPPTVLGRSLHPAASVWPAGRGARGRAGLGASPAEPARAQLAAGTRLSDAAPGLPVLSTSLDLHPCGAGSAVGEPEAKDAGSPQASSASTHSRILHGPADSQTRRRRSSARAPPPAGDCGGKPRKGVGIGGHCQPPERRQPLELPMEPLECTPAGTACKDPKGRGDGAGRVWRGGAWHVLVSQSLWAWRPLSPLGGSVQVTASGLPALPPAPGPGGPALPRGSGWGRARGSVAPPAQAPQALALARLSRVSAGKRSTTSGAEASPELPERHFGHDVKRIRELSRGETGARWGSRQAKAFRLFWNLNFPLPVFTCCRQGSLRAVGRSPGFERQRSFA